MIIASCFPQAHSGDNSAEHNKSREFYYYILMLTKKILKH